MTKYRAGVPRTWTYVLFAPCLVMLLFLDKRTSSGAYMMFVFASLFALCALFMIPTTFHVGDDGVYLQWLFFRRFVPFSALLEVVVERGTAMSRNEVLLTFLRSDGRPIKLAGRWWANDARKFDEAAEAVRKAVDAYRRPLAASTFDASTLDRKTASAIEWLDRLRTLASNEGGFRDAVPPSPDDLASVLADAHAPEDRRAGAALLLAAHDEGRQRLRVARDSTASPKLRVAIDAALGGDDDAVVAALRHVAGAEGER